MFYLNDYQQQKGFTNTQFFTPSGTIDLLEENTINSITILCKQILQKTQPKIISKIV
jgi:hypothetical protein